MRDRGCDNESMTGWKKVTAWGLVLVIGVGAIAFGAYLAITNLDRADKIASVTGALVSLVGVGLSAWGVFLARRASDAPRLSRQTVERVDAGSGVDVVDGVAGSVRLGTPALSRATDANPAPVSGDQEVRDVKAGGHIRVIRGVGGDVDGTT